MLPSVTARAASTRIPVTLAKASAQLIPPIPLYRRLLRAHRQLPNEMRLMGDQYIKSEFRLTRTAENPLHVMAFLSQWKSYLDEVETGLAQEGDKWRGRKLDTEALNSLSSEQVGQLYVLMHSTDDVWKSPEELEAEAAKAEAEAEEGKTE